jgi:hypothetical protein
MLKEWSDNEPDPPPTLAQRVAYYFLMGTLGVVAIVGIYSMAVLLWAAASAVPL